jgi:transposase
MVDSLECKPNNKEIPMSPKKEDTSTVTVVHPICCGLDVHKDTISACLLLSDKQGGERSEFAEFGTFTDELEAMREWLLKHQCPVVAMESTGPYWTPVHNVLEGFLNVMLVNPRHMKNVPGRKTDVSDSRWIAGLLRHGLLRGAFIPPKAQRQWRDLTRMRKNYVKSQGDFKRRVHKLLQSANLKIDSVLSNLFGLSGQNLMNLLINSDSHPTLEQVEQCLAGSVKEKARELHRSIRGFFEEHHRDLLRLLLESIEYLDGQIKHLDEKIRRAMNDRQEVIDRLKDIPGISDVSAHALLSEIGPNPDAFENPAALASWCGLCPGNNQSAGKRRTGRSRVHKNHLKEIMIEVAWPAIKKRGSYFKAKYYALKARVGPKKAIVAVAHRILKAVYYVIKDATPFKDLGEDYLVKLNKESKLKYLRKQAALLGFELIALPEAQKQTTGTLFAQV